MLHYRAGDFNCLHQDLYGPVAFPFQVVFFLSEPGEQYSGGEFLLVENPPRAQSMGRALRPNRGDALVITTRHRPGEGKRSIFESLRSTRRQPRNVRRALDPRHHLPRRGMNQMVQIPVIEPFPWASGASYLTYRSTPGLERVEPAGYTRLTSAGTVSVSYDPDARTLAAHADGTVPVDWPARIARIFYASHDPKPVARVLRRCPTLRPLLAQSSPEFAHRAAGSPSN